MPFKSDLFDYEPLRGPGAPSDSESDEWSQLKERQKSKTAETGIPLAESRPFDSEEEPLIKRPSSQLASTLPKREASSDKKKVRTQTSGSKNVGLIWTLKKGHSLSFAGLFAFTFLVFFRPYEFSPSLFWLSKGALVTAIFTLLVFVPTQLGLENKLTVRPREVNLVLLLLFLGLLSVPLATDKLQAWSSFVEYLKVVAMFVVMVNVVRTEKRLKALLLLVLVATCILSFAAINDYRAGHLALGGKRIEGVIGGLFDNPNDLALHLVTFFPIIIGLALGSKNPFSKIIYFVAGVLVLGAVIVTFSRGGFIGLIFVIGVLIWRLGRRNRMLVLVATISLVIMVLALAPGAYRERITTTGDASAEARTGELKRSIYLALRHPIFGVGMDNFVLFSNTEHATHNSYTQVASEMGLPATIVYVLFIIAAIKRVRRIFNVTVGDKKKRRLRYLAIGLEASLVGYMVVSFFASVAYLWYVYYLAGYAICLGRLTDVSVQARDKGQAQGS